MARRGQCRERSAAAQRHGDEQLVGQVFAHRNAGRQVSLGLLDRAGGHFLGRDALAAETGEYFGDRVLYIRPNDPKDIHDKIKTALGREKTNELSDLVLDSFTWDKVADRTIEGYRKVVAK